MRMVRSIRLIDLSWADLIMASANNGVWRAANGRHSLERDVVCRHQASDRSVKTNPILQIGISPNTEFG